MAYSAEQLKVIRAIQRIGHERYAGAGHEGRVKIKAALETGKVETNYRNLDYGDADSKGWRQERSSLYRDPTNLKASINRFYDEADQHYKGQPAGQLAADVQRPAAQYRGRYGQVAGEAKALLSGIAQGGSGGTQTVRTTTTSGNPDYDSQRQSLLLNYVANRDDGDALLKLASGLQGIGSPLTSRTSSVTTPIRSPEADTKLEKILNRATRIDSKHFPYQWGGGHSADAKHKAVPLDCSGAVSKVLGINPMVAEQFKSWGKAGKGKGMTVYAAKDGSHVLMSVVVNGKERFWGTSASNPGGGAGWIPRSALSDQYLSRFVARHQPGI